MSTFTAQLCSLVHTLSFWVFIAIKVAGTSFAAWSWWWLLFPVIPFVGLFVERFGL
jgi:hypothetical protein